MRNWSMFQRLTAALVFILSFSSIALASGVIELPQTGQHRCYDHGGYPIANCTGRGHDAEWKAGIPLPPYPRYVAGTGAEAACMIDTLTGLMWPKNGNLAGGTKTWQEALDYANDFTLCGHTDWRLPNAVELMSLIDYGQPDTAAWLNSHGYFSGVQDAYWSSSTQTEAFYRAWFVYMKNGHLGHTYKTNSRYVWPVRAGLYGSFSDSAIKLPKTGQEICYDTSGSVIGCAGTGQDGDWKAGIPWPNPRFESGSGAETDCITDKLTGLMWPKNGNLVGGTKTWDEAFYVNDLTLCGHTDWRLPNIVELKSLINYEGPDMAAWLNTQGFYNMQTPSAYSSSTTDPSSTASAMHVNSDNSSVYSGSKTCCYSVLPVRGGQSAILPPVAPEGLKATANSSGKITLAWQDKSIYETGYRVFRKAGTGKFALLKSLPENTETYIDSTAAGNDTTTYSYYVNAIDAGGFLSKNTPQAVVPYKPTNLVATKVTNGIKLSWTDNSANEKGFKIYRTEGTCSSTNPLKLIATTAANATTFTNTGLASGTYSYKAKAFTQSVLQPYSYGYSTFSNCVTVTVP